MFFPILEVRSCSRVHFLGIPGRWVFAIGRCHQFEKYVVTSGLLWRCVVILVLRYAVFQKVVFQNRYLQLSACMLSVLVSFWRVVVFPCPRFQLCAVSIARIWIHFQYRCSIYRFSVFLEMVGSGDMRRLHICRNRPPLVSRVFTSFGVDLLSLIPPWISMCFEMDSLVFLGGRSCPISYQSYNCHPVNFDAISPTSFSKCR